MADASVTFLLTSLKDVLSDQINLISNASAELDQLKNDLRLMKAFLKDASTMKNKDEQFKEYERQVREVVYVMEDTIDCCTTKATVDKAKNIFRRILNVEWLNLAKEVGLVREKKVKGLFNSVFTELGKITTANASNTITAQGSTGRRAPRQDNVVGFEDETEKLIGYLNEVSDELEVISITGMPGIGKTTLAWKIYRDTRIHEVFPKVIWINVSQEFNKKDMLLIILKKFIHDEDVSSKSVDDLAKLVLDYLGKEKFLIFFDDVWTIDDWNRDIQSILPKSNKTAKVLITSRSDKLARHANNRRHPYKLQLQDKNESWELLQLEAFGRLCDCPTELEKIGKLIAEDCKGHPLAIKVIGDILAQINLTAKGSLVKKWEKVHESIETSLYHDDQQKRMKDIISLSYTSLDYDLRDCFLYLGIFPKNTEIPAWRLTQLWIAEGFIQQIPGKSLEEIAQNNLKELIDWNLVIVDKTNPDDTVKTCCVHSTISEFCRNEAAFNNIFQEIRKSGDGIFEPSLLQEVQSYRRVCINSCVGEFLSKKPKVTRARSFIGFSKEPTNLEDKGISSITHTFSLLRVLDANTFRFTKFPTKLTKLVHLRYIILVGDEFKVLPKAMSNLCNIQTLIVDTLLPTLEIKADIWKMMQLKHFKTKASIILKKNGKGKGGENLRTLSRLSPESCTEEVFKKAKNLKTLGIRGQLDRLWNSTCLDKLERLEKLKLIMNVDSSDKLVPLEIPLQRLPQKFPPNITILTLSGTHMYWSQMSIVGNIGTLEVLKCKDNAFMGDRWDAVGGGFLCLQLLHIEETNLKIWTASDEPFPQLTSLVLKNCKELEQVPLDELGRHFKILSMEGILTRSAVDSARKMVMEKQKLIQAGQGIRAGRNEFKLVIAPADDM